MKSLYLYATTIVIHKGDLDWANQKARAKYLHTQQDLFVAGLSTDGLPPPDGYWATFPIKFKHLSMLVALADAKPRTWIWVWVRPGGRGELIKLKNLWNLPNYKDIDWQTRANAWVGIREQKPSPQLVLDNLDSFGYTVQEVTG